jgi:hypothetical protein
MGFQEVEKIFKRHLGAMSQESAIVCAFLADYHQNHELFGAQTLSQAREVIEANIRALTSARQWIEEEQPPIQAGDGA